MDNRVTPHTCEVIQRKEGENQEDYLDRIRMYPRVDNKYTDMVKGKNYFGIFGIHGTTQFCGRFIEYKYFPETNTDGFSYFVLNNGIVTSEVRDWTRINLISEIYELPNFNMINRKKIQKSERMGLVNEVFQRVPNSNFVDDEVMSYLGGRNKKTRRNKRNKRIERIERIKRTKRNKRAKRTKRTGRNKKIKKRNG